MATQALEVKTAILGSQPAGVSILSNIADTASLIAIETAVLATGSTAQLADGSQYYFSSTAVSGGLTPTSGGGQWLPINSSGVFNAVSFGLKAGDNTAQDTNKAALIALFAFAAARAQTTIVIPDGDYYINCAYVAGVPQFNVPSGVTIQMGKYTRLIVDLAGSTQTHVMLRLNRVSNVRISGGEIVGDNAAVGAGVGVMILGTGVNMSSNVVVENVVCRDMSQDNFYVEDGTNISFLNCEGYNADRSNLSITRGSNMLISGCIFDGANAGVVGAGVNLETEGADDVTDIIFQNCRFTNNASDGFYCHKGSGAGVPKRIFVLGCLFASNGGLGISAVIGEDINVSHSSFKSMTSDSISFADISRGSIRGNTITGGNKGVYILRSSNLEITGNVISDTADSAFASLQGTTVATFCNAINFSHNIIENSGEHAIDFRASCSRVIGNRINRCQKDGFRGADGTFNNTVSNNEIFNVGLATNATWRGIVDGGCNHVYTGNKVRKGKSSQRDIAAAGGASTITLSSRASAIDDFYNGMKIAITSGTGSGQTADVLDYVGSTQLLTVTAPWATPPDATSVYEIYPAGNLPAYGGRFFSGNSFIHDNDFSLSGVTANYQDLGVGNDAAGNRTT